jgi:thiol-activated cytolysin
MVRPLQRKWPTAKEPNMPRALLVPALSSVLLLAGCASDGAGSGDPTGESIGEYLDSLQDLPSAPPSSKAGEPSSPQRDGDYSCSTQNYSETKQYDKIVALSANSESLWPGAIVSGDSVYTGLFTQLVFDRAPLAVSISLENLAGQESMKMEAPSLSSFRDGLGKILAQDVTGSTPADIYSEVSQVYSEQQLTLALGASVAYAGAKVSASFDWSNQQVLSRYVVNYTQAYYTVDVDQPSGPEAFFGPNVSLDLLKANVGIAGPPVYVSSITYGRMVIFTFESQYSGEEMGAALDFAYKGGIDVSGSVSVSYKDIISNSKITAFILGGDGGAAAQSIDSYDSLMAFIKSGGNYSKDSPGAAIAYKLAYLKDNSPARLSYTTDYTVRSCTRVGQQIQVTLSSIKVNSAGGDAGSDLELYGKVTATARAKGGKDGAPVTLLSKDADHAIVIAENQGWPLMGTIDEEILDVVPQSGSVITLSANLTDVDTWPNGDDNICNDSVQVAFDQGWHKDVPIHCTGSAADVVVTLHIQPI